MSENTLLTKAKQCLTEKLTNLTPEVLKQGVTAFSVEGTLTAEQNFTINSKTKLIIDGPALSSLIEGQVTDEEKEYYIDTTSSGYPNLIPVFTGYEPLPQLGDFTSVLVCIRPTDDYIYLSAMLSRNYSGSELSLIDLATIDYPDSSTTPLYTDMTVGSFLQILNHMGTKEVSIRTNREYVVSRLYSSYLPVLIESTSSRIMLPAFNTTQSLSLYQDSSTIITYGDDVTVNATTLASIIDNNTTAEEKAAYVNMYDSGNYSPMVEITTCTHANSDTQFEETSTIALHGEYNPAGGGDSINLVCSTSQPNHSYFNIVDPLLTESSVSPFPDEITVSDLIHYLEVIDIALHTAKVSAHETILFPEITSIRICGPDIDKTIDVSVPILEVE